ncbi:MULTISPECIES: OmpW/AlkL family protein [Microbulbifer]|uniref:OmpW family protein n=1 Tax=Microbulbifer celer TaxID=435905 RepID=A0ABW3UCZ8_9GAMM|nr:MULTISPECIES: OmpW family outer membrane protein [Microbulbifer]UFN59165.1 hypothetical protein LPW13_09075 [Microbulbifer celer]
MKMTRVLTPLAIAISALVSAQQASAAWWDEGDYTVRVGASWVDPSDDKNNLRLSDRYHAVDMNLDTETTWNISGVWKPVEHWGVELMYVGATEQDMKIRRIRSGNQIISGGNFKLGQFDASYSNAFVNWFPLSEDCLGQPYVGIGVNYTDFSDESYSRDVNDVLIDSGETLNGASLGLGHSWGVVGQVGVDFRFGREDSFLVNAAVMYIDADTDFNTYYRTAEFPRVTQKLTVNDIDYSPWVFNLGVGYSF